MSASVEAWSGKDRGQENFPVGSLLIRRALRPHVHAYYVFARNADDIADNPAFGPEEKIARLDVMQAVLLGERQDGSPAAAGLRGSLAQTGVAAVHATDLLIAFRQDAVKTRYTDLNELLEYCRFSAAPVGRYLLDLHGEPAETHAGSDALCASLQILNHLQDLAPDLARMNRSYLPATLLAAHGAAVTDVQAAAASPALRAVIDALLDVCDRLNGTARSLAPACLARGMRLESATIVALAHRLAARLRAGDPIAGRVALSRADFARGFIGAFRQW